MPSPEPIRNGTGASILGMRNVGLELPIATTLAGHGRVAPFVGAGWAGPRAQQHVRAQVVPLRELGRDA